MKLVILQTVTPDYRSKLFLYLKEQLGTNFELYGGNYYFEKSIKSDSSLSIRRPIANFFLVNRKFLFQMGMWSCVIKKNVLVIELNPRILSNWIILFIRQLIRRKTVLWGHAWPRAGASSKSDKIRNLMRNFGDQIIVYTNTQREELKLKMPNKIIKSAPNAVYYKNEMIANKDSASKVNIIYVGRLVKSKKPLSLLKSFHNALEYLPHNANLIFVGDGEERQKLEHYINKQNLEARVKTLGHIGDYERLKELYFTSLFSVSPGYVGLSITQSFSFGVPMLISKFENHSPEIEAVIENENAIFFKTDEIDDLSKKIINFYNAKNIWIDKEDDIINSCKDRYSIETMASTFIDLI